MCCLADASVGGKNGSRPRTWLTLHGHSGSWGDQPRPQPAHTSPSSAAHPCVRIPWMDGHIWGGEGRNSAVENLHLPYGWRLFLSFSPPPKPPQTEILQPPRRGQHIAPERWPCCWPTLLCPQAAPPCIKGRILSLKKSLHPVHSLGPWQSDLI